MEKIFNEMQIYFEAEKKLLEILNKISYVNNLEAKVYFLNEAYKYVKEITPYFFINGHISPYFKRIKTILLKCERLLNDKFLIKNTPIYKEEKRPFVSKDNYKEILDYVVYETRKKILKANLSSNLNQLNLLNYCIISNSYVLSLLDSLGLTEDSFPVTLTPGFVDEPELYDGSGYHCISFIRLGERYFLIDCTYAQYFILGQNSLERTGIINLMNCKPGNFMIMNEDRFSVANEILTKGWIELDEDTFKHYMDGFVFFYRNGLYYDLTNDYSYDISYSAEDYYNFIIGKDSLLNYEKKETLGYQKVPNSKYL